MGEKVDDIEIAEVELNPFNSPANETVSIQVEQKSMVARLKRLDGVICLGKRLTVRR